MFRAFSLVFILMVPVVGIAQALLNYNVSQFTTKEGLISNVCHDVVADEEGFIWVAINGGLMRFDGSSFVSFGEETGLNYLNTMTP